MADIYEDKKALRKTGKNILLVEGKDDYHVVSALCDHYSLEKNFGIYPCDNDIGILKRFHMLIARSDSPEAIGIVIDADSKGVNGRKQQIEKKIKNHSSYSFPKAPDPEGTILLDNEGKQRLGFWIMPNNKDVGSLEDFLMKMADQKGIASAYDCVNTAKAKGVTAFTDVHINKAIIHTYLAWQDEPGKPFGQSITAHALQPETETAKAFINWLKELFSRKLK